MESNISSAFPEDLQAIDAWVVWKEKGSPISAETKLRKNWNKNPASFTTAAKWCEENPGYRLGFLFEYSPDIFGLDLDACRDPETGSVATWALDLIKSVSSYSEISQSGTGIKILGRSQTTPVGRTYFVDAPGFGDHDPQIEIFFSAKYFALTGDVFSTADGEIFDQIKEIDLKKLSESFETRVQYVGDLFKKTKEAPSPSPGSSPPVPFEGPRPYQAIYNSETSIEGLLLSAGWRKAEGGYKRPGKQSDGISATIKVVDGVERLTNWSTSVPELPASDPGGKATTFDAWSVNARINFGGDFGAAKKSYLSSRPDLQERSDPAADFGPPNPATAIESKFQSETVEPNPLAKVPVAIREILEGPISESLGDLSIDVPELRPVIVDGLFREGETVNLISASKMGKSLLAAELSYCVAEGGTWLGTFDVPRARRVLVLDNELHRETLRWRYYEVAKARGICFEFGAEIPPIEYRSMRGRVPNIYQLKHYFDRIETGYYGMILLDAFYRFLPAGTNESDNGEMTQIYNALDSYASRLRSAIVLIHHSSKGDQSQKSRVDVGSGAGAMARAADSHLVIRDHETEGLSVLEGETRSFRRPTPLSIELDGLRWQPADAAPILRGPGPRIDKSRDLADTDRILSVLESSGPMTKNGIFDRGGLDIGKGRLSRLLSAAAAAKILKNEKIPGKAGVFYSVIQGPKAKSFL